MTRDFPPWYRDATGYAAFVGSYITLLASYYILGWQFSVRLVVVGLAAAIISGLLWRVGPFPNSIGAND